MDLVRSTSCLMIDLDLTMATCPREDGFQVQKVTSHRLSLVKA